MTCTNYLLSLEELKNLFELKHQKWPGDESLKKENFYPYFVTRSEFSRPFSFFIRIPVKRDWVRK